MYKKCGESIHHGWIKNIWGKKESRCVNEVHCFLFFCTLLLLLQFPGDSTLCFIHVIWSFGMEVVTKDGYLIIWSCTPHTSLPNDYLDGEPSNSALDGKSLTGCCQHVRHRSDKWLTWKKTTEQNENLNENLSLLWVQISLVLFERWGFYRFEFNDWFLFLEFYWKYHPEIQAGTFP